MNTINSLPVPYRSYILMALAVSFFAGIILLSCQKPTSSESTVRITGTIENPEDDTIFFRVILADTLLKAPIEEGAFTVLIPVREPFYCILYLENEFTRIYLTPNEDFNLSANMEKFDETLKYTGAGAGPNNYLIAKYLLDETEPWKKEYYQKNESEFMDFMDERRAAAMHHLESFSSDQKLPTRFIEIEKKKYDVIRASMLMKYVEVGRYKNSEFTVSDDFFSFKDQIDINDEEFASVSNMSFGFYLLKLAKHNYGSLGIGKRDLMKTTDFIESNISNQKVLDHALYTIVFVAFKDGIVDDTEEEIIKRFFEKCKNPAYRSLIEEDYAHIKDQSNRYKALVGSPATAFEYADINGNKIALEDMQGNIVYIDVWATWCAPCLKELPALEKLQHKYKNDKISFVSISVDENKSAWDKMVAKKDMKGIQLISDKAFDSAICKEFVIEGIPRFILIDHDGLIVDPDAPRPSSDEIEPLLNKVLAKI